MSVDDSEKGKSMRGGSWRRNEHKRRLNVSKLSFSSSDSDSVKHWPGRLSSKNANRLSRRSERDRLRSEIVKEKSKQLSSKRLERKSSCSSNWK